MKYAGVKYQDRRHLDDSYGNQPSSDHSKHAKTSTVRFQHLFIDNTEIFLITRYCHGKFNRNFVVLINSTSVDNKSFVLC